MKNKIKYIFNLFEKIYRIKLSDYDINYGINNKSKIQIKIGDISFYKSNIDYDIKNIIWKEWKNQKIPFLFDYCDDKDIFTFEKNCLIINYDIISSSFFFLSGWQEKNYDYKKNERFRFADSLQFKLNILHIPVVNYYFDILKEAINRIYNLNITERLFDNNKNGVFFVSHDIDFVKHSIYKNIYEIDNKSYSLTKEIIEDLTNLKFPAIIKMIFYRLIGKYLWNNIEEIMELEKKLNIKSTFFILFQYYKKKKLFDNQYNILEKKYKKIIENIKKNGFEIALHGYISDKINYEEIEKKVKILNIKLMGNRFHFLKFNINNNLDFLNNLRIKYDSSYYFAEQIGFRSSFAHPFNIYDIKNDKETDVLEIPLNVMDATLAFKKYMNIQDKDEILEKIDILIDEIIKFKGCFSLLWHNHFMSEYKYLFWKEIFIAIIEKLKSKNLISLTGKEIFEIYNSNTK